MSLPWRGFLGALMNVYRRQSVRELEAYAVKTLTADDEWCPRCEEPKAGLWRYDIITEDGGLVLHFRWCEDCQTMTQMD